MTEQYEYERVEIKPECFDFFGAEVVPVLKHYSPDDCMPVAKICGIGKTDVLLVGRSGLDITFSLKDYDFYIRKPKRKMVKKARAVFVRPGPNDSDELRIFRSRPITEQEVKVYIGDDLIKWPYGEIIEVEEGL